jgi:tRNA 2-thiocytidine biosynthesis protein TtcA
MLRDWEKKHPGRLENMFNALKHTVPSHLLDASLFDFQHLKATGAAFAGGDTAFDAEEFAPPTVGGLAIR